MSSSLRPNTMSSTSQFPLPSTIWPPSRPVQFIWWHFESMVRPVQFRQNLGDLQRSKYKLTTSYDTTCSTTSHNGHALATKWCTRLRDEMGTAFTALVSCGGAMRDILLWNEAIFYRYQNGPLLLPLLLLLLSPLLWRDYRVRLLNYLSYYYYQPTLQKRCRHLLSFVILGANEVAASNLPCSRILLHFVPYERDRPFLALRLGVFFTTPVSVAIERVIGGRIMRDIILCTWNRLSFGKINYCKHVPRILQF